MIPRALLAGVCAVTLFAPLATAGDSELTKVKVAFLPAEPAVLVAYAKHRAMFTKQGIDAEMVPRNDPQLITAALLSGDVQFSGTHAGNALLFKTRGLPVKVVAAGALYDPKHPTSALVAGRGKSIARPRDLVGKTILIDSPTTVAHIGVLKWLKRGGVSPDDLTIKFVLFADMLPQLANGQVDAAFMPEPFLTQVRQQGLKVIAYPFNAVCSKKCLTTFWVSGAGVDENLRARFRNAVQKAAIWANEPENDPASAKIFARYVKGIDPKVMARMERTRFGTRLRLPLVQPWIDAYAEFGYIPSSFKAIDLVK